MLVAGIIMGIGLIIINFVKPKGTLIKEGEALQEVEETPQ